MGAYQEAFFTMKDWVVHERFDHRFCFFGAGVDSRSGRLRCGCTVGASGITGWGTGWWASRSVRVVADGSGRAGVACGDASRWCRFCSAVASGRER